jgi:hypothetical protein
MEIMPRAGALMPHGGLSSARKAAEFDHMSILASAVRRLVGGWLERQ